MQKKMSNFKHKIRLMPVALTGMALGVSGISGALATIIDPKILYVGNFISLLLMLPIITKNILHFDVLKEELRHPVLGSLIPTLDMALMNFSVVLFAFSKGLGRGLWLLSIVLHFIFFGFFAYYRLKSWKTEHMVPSWFVPPIGIVVACVSSAPMGMHGLAQFLFYVGFFFYVVMLPVMMYRVIFLERIDDARLPTFAIMAAPPNLCLAGYLTAFSNPNPAIVNFLFPLGIFMTGLMYVSMFRIFKVKFSPMYAGFTFPLAIGVTAVLKYSKYIGKIDPARGEFWYKFTLLSATVATIIITCIVVRAVLHIRKHTAKAAV